MPGRILNRWGQWKLRMVLVECLTVIGQLGVNIEGWVVGASSRVGEEGMVLMTVLAMIRKLGVDVKGRVVGSGDIFNE